MIFYKDYHAISLKLNIMDCYVFSTVTKHCFTSKCLSPGYVEAAVIPEGARNIRVEEVAEANNFLALQNADGINIF